MEYAKYVGRVGALAVALGIGTAVISNPGVVLAEEDGSSAGSSADSSSSSGDGQSPGAQSGGSQSQEKSSAPSSDPPQGSTTQPSDTSTGSVTIGNGSVPEVTISSSGGALTSGDDDVKQSDDGDPDTDTATSPDATAAPSVGPSAGDAPAASSGVTSGSSAAPLLSPPAGAAPAAPASASVEPAPPTASQHGPRDVAPQRGDVATNQNGVEGDTSRSTVQTTRLSRTSGMIDDPVDADAGQADPSTSTFSTLADNSAPVAAAVAVPAPDPVSTLLAVPASFINAAVNFVVGVLQPFVAPGGPLENATLFALLAWTRRQSAASFANSTPEIGRDTLSLDVGKDTAGTSIGLLPAADVDGDTITYTVDPEDAAQNGTVMISGNIVTYRPAAGFTGSDDFTLVASDANAGGHIHAPGQSHVDSATVGITVSAVVPVNSAPVSVGDGYSVMAGQTLSVGAGAGVLANDSDVDGDVLSVALVTDAGHGAVQLNGDGSFTYTPVVGYSGADSFSYRASDGTVDGAEATVSITVDPVSATNPEPVSGLPVGSPLVGSTGTVYQTIVRSDTDGNSPTFFVRAYQSSGELVGDTETFSGDPGIRVVRADGGISVVTFDSASQTATIRVINGTDVTTTSVQATSLGVGGLNGSLYLVTGYQVDTSLPRGNIVPLTAGAPIAYESNGRPDFGPDGTAVAFNVTGTGVQDISASLLVINPDGTTRAQTAPTLRNFSEFPSIGPNGIVYLPTLTDAGTQVLVFDTEGVTVRDVNGLFPVERVAVAPDGTAYLLTKESGLASSYQISVLNGAVRTVSIGEQVVAPTVLEMSADGTLYLLSNYPYDQSARVLVVRPDGSVQTVPLGSTRFEVDHFVGTDNNLYVSYTEEDNDVSVVITPTGQKRFLTFPAATAPVFSANGTAYIAAETADGVVVRRSTDGFATYVDSDPVALNGEAPKGLSVGPDGTVYVSTSTRVTAIDSDGTVIGSVSGGQVVGPVVIDQGAGYVTVMDYGTNKTTVSAITPTGSALVKEIAGTPPSGDGPALSVGSGVVYISTFTVDSSGAAVTQVSLAPTVSPPTDLQ